MIRLVLPAILLALWWALARWGAFPAILLPAPQAVLESAWSMAASGELLRHVLASLARVGTGFLIAAGAALVLAFLFFRKPAAERFSAPVLESLRVVPPLALIPLLILWLGIDEGPKLSIVVLSSFFPVHVAALGAFRNAANEWGELIETLRLTPAEAMRHVLLPGASSELLRGIRVGFGYAWRALVGAELLAAASGLGYLIEDAGALGQTDRVIVGILVIALLGIAADVLLMRLLNALVPRAGQSIRKDSLSEQSVRDEERKESERLLRKLPAVRFEGVTKRYPTVTPLDNLTLTLEAGCVTALLGRSGCGKTTLLKLAAGLSEPDEGGITGIDGAESAVVFQAPKLLPWKSVAENIGLALLHEAEEPAVRRARVERALALVGLAGRSDEAPDHLSGGQAQRAALARALVRRPELLLLDEPFGALDALTRSQLQRECAMLFNRDPMTVLLITHDVREAVLLADRILVMDSGRMVVSIDVEAPRPRRIGDPALAALEETLLARLLG